MILLPLGSLLLALISDAASSEPWPRSRVPDAVLRRCAELAERFQDFLFQHARTDGVAEEEILRWARQAGVGYLGAGGSRAVFDVGGYACKIDLRVQGRITRDNADNLREVDVWLRAPAWLRPHLVPVLAWDPDGFWLLMEKVTPGGKMARETREGLRACGIHDVLSDNLSTDGRMLDYAFVEPLVFEKPAQGRLRMLYHGTTSHFDDFDLEMAGRRDSGNLGRGIYLTDDLEAAMMYAERNAEAWGEDPVVLQILADVDRVAVLDASMRARISRETDVAFPPAARDSERSEALRRWFMWRGFHAARSGSEWVVFEPERLRIVGEVEHVPEGERLRRRLALR